MRGQSFLLVSVALLLGGCKPPEQPVVTCIVGAVLMDGTGGPPISGSVVTIENGRVRAAGPRTGLLVPPEAVKIDGAGKFIVPGLIDVMRGGRFAVVRPGDSDGAIEQARGGGKPLFGDVSSWREARVMVDRGVTGLLHMARDAEAPDPAFVARLRDLRIVVIPMLAQERVPALLALVERNTKRLADGGVAIAAGSGGDIQREMELLVAAGMTPAEVLIAATRNGAAALRESDEVGTLEAGKRADLLFLAGNPAEDIGNLRKVDRVMRAGVWVEGNNK